jgi:hypothetical protein
MATECASLMVEGVGRASAMPDLARISVHVASQGKKASEARRACAEQAEAILRQLEHAGVPREDMGTAFYEVEQIRDERKRDSPVIGCRASTNIAVTLHKPEELGRIIEQALDLGPDVAWTASFDLSSESRVKAEALGEAVRDACRKAENMATAAGLQIKRVVSIKAAGIEEVLRARPEVRDSGPMFLRESLTMEHVAAESMRKQGVVQRGLREYQAKVTMEFELGQ